MGTAKQVRIIYLIKNRGCAVFFKLIILMLLIQKMYVSREVRSNLLEDDSPRSDQVM